MDKYIVDIHSHILFGVDDGAKNIDESKELIIDAYNQGTRKMVATPHLSSNTIDIKKEKIMANFIELEKFVKDKYEDFNLYLGSEVYYTYDIIDKIKNNDLIFIAGSEYILIEFNENTEYKTIYNILRNIFMCGKVPVIAHVERYDELAFSSERIDELIGMGCIIHLDADSVLKGSFFKNDKYKKRSKFLLKNDYVHCVASDVHNMSDRKNNMKKAYEYIEKKYGEERAKLLFCINPLSILENKLL